MPKIVDHDERRSEVLEATWRVIREQGLEAATVRQIAKAAGLSHGVLAHYFASKDDILIQAHKMAYDRVGVRVDERSTGLDSVARLRLMLDEALPLDEERRLEAVIDVSYLSRALTNPALNDVRADSVRWARSWWMDALRAAQGDDSLRASLDLELAVHEVLVFIDGVSIQAVLYPEMMTAEVQRHLADELIAGLLR